MRTFEDKEEAYLLKLENEAVRSSLPRGLLDEKGNQLKYDLHYCLTRNDWWFTMGEAEDDASSSCITSASCQRRSADWRLSKLAPQGCSAHRRRRHPLTRPRLDVQ